MTQDERVHFKIALPIELKKKLEHEAVENRRSLSAEIIARLESSFSEDGMTILINADRQNEAFDKIAASIVRHIMTGGGEVGPHTEDQAKRIADFLLAANKSAAKD